MSAPNAVWNRDRVAIATELGRVHREAWASPAAPGLAVTLSTVTAKSDRWVVTHVASGRVIQSKAFLKRNSLPIDFGLATAKRLAIALAAIGDWTQTDQRMIETATAEFSRALCDAFTQIVQPLKQQSGSAF